MTVTDFTMKTKELIDNLKSTCASYGLGNDGNESKIITQVFLYKFMNDKFGYDLKQIDKQFSGIEPWEKTVSELPDSEFNKLVLRLNPGTAKLKKEHLLSHLYNNQNTNNFSKLFDRTLIDISQYNAAIFSVSTSSNAKIVLFDELSQFISDPSSRDDFCKAIINQLVNFSFEKIFMQKFDFFSTIFEYLIKDYNKDGGGKYAEYYTPHAVSKIMAKILVVEDFRNVTIYDPSAGSGTLLMNVAHQIGENNCSIYSQDVSQKSSGMLRLNLILNNLVHSIPNVIQGNTLTSPHFKSGSDLQRFDFIVSNPPFKLDFSDFRDELETGEHRNRFFAGIPSIPAKKRESMAIYLLFLQHIIYSLSAKGKAAVVVPTGFVTGQDKISIGIRRLLIEKNILTGVVSMPSNIFARTGTNVSIVFIDKSRVSGDVLLVDASELGETVKEGKNQKTVLSSAEEERIIDIFRNPKNIEQFSVLASPEAISSRNLSFSAGQYFDVAIDIEPISPEEFANRISTYKNQFQSLHNHSREVENELLKQISRLDIG